MLKRKDRIYNTYKIEDSFIWKSLVGSNEMHLILILTNHTNLTYLSELSPPISVVQNFPLRKDIRSEILWNVKIFTNSASNVCFFFTHLSASWYQIKLHYRCLRPATNVVNRLTLTGEKKLFAEIYGFCPYSAGAWNL